MNKKAFTLVETIICIAILGVILVTGIVIINNSNNYDLLETTNEILNSARLFIELEKDENGKNYSKEIVNGAKGVKIPLQTLVDKGYIDEKDANKIYDKKSSLLMGDNQDLYVMFLNGGKDDENDYCKLGEITSLASWMIEDKPVYLCNDYENSFIQNNKTILNPGLLTYDIDTTKFAVSTEYIEKLKSEGKDVSNFTDKENGMFVFNQDGEVYVYFRGAVDNNYVVIGNDNETGAPLTWRIIWLRNDNKMKLVLDKTIDLNLSFNSILNLQFETDQSAQLLPDFESKYQNDSDYNEKLDTFKSVLVESNCNTSTQNYCKFNNFYLLKAIISDEKIEFASSGMDQPINMQTYSDNYYFSSDYYIGADTNNLYYKKLLNWYETKTNLSDFEYITKENNFCFNTTKLIGADYETTIPSKTFVCNNLSDTGEIINNSLSFPIYFLDYGDVIMAGIADMDTQNNTKDLSRSGNYLYSDNKSFILASQSRRRDRWEYWYTLEKIGLSSKMSYQDYGGYGDWFFRGLEIPDELQTYYGLNYMTNIRANVDFLPSDGFKPTIVIDLNEYTLGVGDGSDDYPYRVIKR